MNKNPENTGGSRDEKGRFIKGVSGNPLGKPEGSISVVSAIKKKLEEYPEGKDKTYLYYLIETIFKKAIVENDVSMIKDIINRIDGMPKQPIVGDKDQPIEITISQEIKDKYL